MIEESWIGRTLPMRSFATSDDVHAPLTGAYQPRIVMRADHDHLSQIVTATDLSQSLECRGQN